MLDIQERRVREMDAHGIELMLLSLNAPGRHRSGPDRAQSRLQDRIRVARLNYVDHE